jgi:hypothetical protein
MRLVSPLMEGVTNGLARAVDSFNHPVPEHIQQFMRLERGAPGLEADPVFIVPGLTADKWMYRRGKEMLEEEGFVVGGMRMPWHGWGGIPGDASKMREGIERTIERAQKAGRDVDHVQLVGDSEGGLISRWFLQFEGGQPLVSRYVSNGTPHGAIRPLGSDKLASIARSRLLPPGVRDLIVDSPVMQRLNADLPDYVERAHAADPNFEMHAIGSRALGHDHDGLVPLGASQLRVDSPIVHNYVTSGAHSINLAYGRRQTEAGHVLLAALGSGDPMAQGAAARASAAAQAFAGTRTLG